MARVILKRGWPDEMQAHLIILEECKKVGGKKSLATLIGISPRYLHLILEWRRTVAHDKVLRFFGWDAVYACAEDIEVLEEHAPLVRPRKREQIVNWKASHNVL